MLLLTAATGAWADEVTFSVGELKNSLPSGNTTIEIPYEWTVSSQQPKVTIARQDGMPGNLSVSTLLPLGKDHTITVSVPTGGSIDGVTFTTNPANQAQNISASTGSCSKKGIWSPGEGDVTSVTFTPTNNFRITDIVVVYSPAPAAPAGYTVSLKDGVKDADNWTVKVGDGEAQALPIGGLKGDGSETVTLQYTGRLKVKGVKATSEAGAPAAKPAATVTTAPTGAAIVGRLNTNSTALVSGGAADGGTLMYAVTKTNTKPTSTAGFSDAVPTAETITASGKVYVWYYVKGDDTHSDSEIAATAIEVPVADIVWDATNVSDLQVYEGDSYQKEGVTLSCNSEMNEAEWNDSRNPEKVGIEFEVMESGGFTFKAPTGKKFTKIEMKPQGAESWDLANLGTGWAINNTTITWTGSAASTVDLLKDAGSFNGKPIISIAFYLSE